MSKWLTPEEARRKQDLRKKILIVFIPLTGIIIGAIITFLINSL